jgi:hypothetical protein
MAIKFNGNLDSIFGDIYKKFEEQIIPSVIEQLEAVCLEVVAEARMLPSPPVEKRGEPHTPNYIDDTGNLRASIGYVVYNNGQKVSQNFEGATEGMNNGIKTATKAAEQYPQGIVAVIVAGENYALCVESLGYNVITGPTSKFSKLFQERLKDINDIYK